MDIKAYVTHQVRSFSLSDLKPRQSSQDQDQPKLRPCQQAYIGPSTARRLFERSTYALRSPHDEAIFVQHDINVRRFDATTFASSAMPSTSYSAECTSSAQASTRHAEHTRETHALLRSINSMRHAEGVTPLLFDPALSADLQAYADIMEDLEPALPASPTSPTTITPSSPSSGDGKHHSARLTSPAGLGALACAELWYGGKYKRHLHRLLPPPSPTFAALAPQHGEDCACHVRKVFEVLVDGAWEVVGIARTPVVVGDVRGGGGGGGSGGRWVVELVEGMASLGTVGGVLVGKTLPELPVGEGEGWRGEEGEVGSVYSQEG